MSADEQAIRDLIARWLQATREGDVGAVLALLDGSPVPAPVITSTVTGLP